MVEPGPWTFPAAPGPTAASWSGAEPTEDRSLRSESTVCEFGGADLLFTDKPTAPYRGRETRDMFVVLHHPQLI